MLYEIEDKNNQLKIIRKYLEKSASELDVEEKTIEDWIADHPELILPKEELLVIGQSIAGKGMADVLALDALGNLVIVEIKRDWSNRATIAQLLEYASDLKDANYERLNRETHGYKKWQGEELINAFCKFIERNDFPQEDLGKRQRIFVVAPDSDLGLKKIVAWLQSYSVPIQFIPFKLLADENNIHKMIDISGAETDVEIDEQGDTWAGHWIFNTNETYAPGAYEKMFSQKVIAIYGYPNGGKNLEGSSAKQLVFAYINRRGLSALGQIIDPVVKSGQGIFLDKDGKQLPEEYHVSVYWEIILSKDRAISCSEAASTFGYKLPVRSVFGKLRRGKFAKKLEEEIRKRGNS